MKTVDWVTWGKAALIRGVRTFAEAMLAYIGTGALVLGDVNWVAALSAGGFGFVRPTPAFRISARIRRKPEGFRRVDLQPGGEESRLRERQGI